MLSVIGIVVSLVLLIVLAYCNISVILLAPLCALVAVAFDREMPLLATYTQIFMPKLGQFIVSYFPLFLLGALFGKLMEDSGSAAKIAQLIVKRMGTQRAVLALVLSCAILTYGGVSLFVVVFAVYPLSRSLFQEASVPKRLIPASIALGSFTFTMSALPGSVQIQNLIPMPYFNTNSFAAPGLGCIGAAIMFTIGMAWLTYRARCAARQGEGFGPTDRDAISQVDNAELPATWRALSPILVVILLNYLFSQHLAKQWSASDLPEKIFGSIEISKVAGLWSTILAMFVAVLFTIAINSRLVRKLNSSLTEGARSALLPIFNTASEFGYGSTIAALAGFATVKQVVTGIAPDNPLVSEAISVNALAAITGSASGGLSIALETLGSAYYARGVEAGIDPQLLHRIASMSCGGLDTLPHNGAVITLLIICGLTHRQSYKDIAVVSVIGPLIATVTILWLGSTWGSF